MMKNTKRFVRIMCLVLAALMVLSLIPAMVLAAEAERTVLASNVDGWDQVCIYFWSDSDTGMTAWPGKLMTQNSAGIYEAQIPDSAQYVIFNNGGNGQQTGDLTLPAGKNLYDLSSQSWSTYEDDAICVHTYGEGTVTTAPTCTAEGIRTYTCTKCGATKTETLAKLSHEYAEGVCTLCGQAQGTGRYIYFRNTGNWSPVHIYFWNGDGAPNGWPGVPMELEEDDIYRYFLPDGMDYVIFNNGNNGQQTSDLPLPAVKDLFDPSTNDWSVYEGGTQCSHVWDTVTVDPTCTGNGSVTKTCTLCGWVTTQTVPATGHSFVDGTCTVCGHTRPTSYRLFYDNTESNWDSVYIYYWSDDNSAMIFWPGEKMVDEGDQIFSYVLPGDAQYVIFNNNNGQQTGDMEIPGDGYLYADGQWIILSVCDHSYDQGVITTEPTCTVAGVKTFTCTLCGETTTQSIAALGHSMDGGRITTEPTCVLDGVKTYTCTVCGQTTTEKVPAKGHTFDGDTCTTCGAPKECTEHSWNEGTVTQEGTCWTPGSKTVTCTVCGKTETQTIPAGHRFYIASVTEPTCTKTGKEYTKCYGCAYSMDKTLPKVPHSYTVPGATVAPTCTTDGYTVYACSGCGAEQNGDLVYHTGHKWSGNTCTACGTTCAHTFVDGICTKCDNGAPAYVEGWYEIGTAAQLRWFASQVNSGNNGINGRLIADIDLKDTAWTAIGYYCSDTLTPNTMPYTGTFDGQGHTVSNFVSNGTDNEGLFGYCESATIRNVGVTGAKITGWRSGAVVGYALTSTVTDCFAKDCTITGKTSNSVALSSGAVYIAPITCPQSGTVSNCYAVDCKLVDSTDLMVETCPVGGLIRSNNYYSNVTFSEAFTYTSNTTEVTAAQLASGEVTYLLNKGITDGTQRWYQTCGTGLPAHSGMTVFQITGTDGSVTYINALCGDDHVEVTVPGKAPTCTEPGLTDGAKCSVCGTVTKAQTQIPALGHKDVTVPGKDATCTTAGLTDGTKCSVCGTVTKAQTEIPAKGHSYENGTCVNCGAADPDAVVDPGLTLNYPTLSFEDEIIYNVYFSVKDMTSVVEMGLMVLPKMDQNATIDDAVSLVPGYVTNGVVYLAKSEGIPAANMGDTLYFKVYAKLSDGSYAYSTAGGYNAKAYANSILKGDNSAEMKSLVVSMLNYGAEAQKFFDHNVDKLVNDALTAEQQALVTAYDTAMMDAIVKADSSKTTNFVRVNSNFRQLYPSVSFDGAFAINFYCAPAITVDDGMTLYYWDMETMESVDKLTVENATGSMEMTDTNGMWWGQVAGIAAKEMDKTYYVSCVFESNGETITTGVIPYSLGKYCSDKAAADGDAQQAFAQATAVYGYYAKNYFASIA